MDKHTAKHPAPLAELVFAVAAIALMLAPAVGTLFAPTTSTTENRELAKPPALVQPDGAFNVNVAADAGAYFEDHFAGRNLLVDANAKLRAALGTSATESVVVGSDGWLYYAGTLPDYLGENRLSEQALRNIAHNLSLLQGFARSRDASFVFTVAPNKNTLYPSHMPANYLQSTEPGNWERLVPYLDEYEVNYVDLFDVLGSADEELYHTRDTHWNNRGALLGANALLQALDKDSIEMPDASWTTRNDYTGDVAKMLYPHSPGTEEAPYAAGYNDGPDQTGTLWSWNTGGDAEEDESSTAGSGEGSLVMYRDSFGNALIPYLSAASEQAYFSKLVPYEVSPIDLNGATAVVVERAERHLDYLSQNAPIMPAPGMRIAEEVPAQATDNAAQTSLEVSQDGNYWVASGTLSEELCGPETRVYLEVSLPDGEVRYYEPSFVSVLSEDGESTLTDFGYIAYLAGIEDMDAGDVRVVYLDKSGVLGVASF